MSVNKYIKIGFDFMLFIIFGFLSLKIYDFIQYKLTYNIMIYYTKSFFLIEFPFLFLLFSIMYFYKIKQKFIKYLAPIILVSNFYLVYDIFYYFFNKSVTLSDMENISSLFEVSSTISVILIVYFMFLLTLVSYFIILILKNYNKKELYQNLFLKLCMFVICIIYYFLVSQSYYSDIFQYTSWSQRNTIRDNGRFNSFIFYTKEERDNMKYLLNKKQSINIKTTLYQGKLKKKPNIYYIVLESFLDPRLIKDISFNKEPLFNGLKKYLHNDMFSTVVSPVYGGGTAQSEFELLTGIKAYAKVKSIEFNVLKGNKIDAFVNQFKQQGYQTHATIATTSAFFNSKMAYKSLGFDNIVFMDEIKVISRAKHKRGDKRITDDILYNFNLEYIKKYLSLKPSKPIFNYLLGIYGHMPYERNISLRPDKIGINFNNATLHRITNQFYYRTKALSEYIDNILKIDPDALIFISSDHLPAVFDKDIRYKFNKHLNIALLLYKNGKENRFVPLEHLEYYKVPHFIWSLLVNQVNKNIDEKEMQNLYYKSLQEGIGH